MFNVANTNIFKKRHYAHLFYFCIYINADNYTYLFVQIGAYYLQRKTREYLLVGICVYLLTQIYLI